LSDSTKEKIKKTALSLFAQRGYHGTTMSDIAKLVGIKTPSIYAHFNGKEELFYSVYMFPVVRRFKSCWSHHLKQQGSTGVNLRYYLFFMPNRSTKDKDKG